MRKKSKPKGSGGKREGAGRKPKYDGIPLVQLSCRVREDTLEIIHDQAATENISRGEWIDRLVLRGWCKPRAGSNDRKSGGGEPEISVT